MKPRDPIPDALDDLACKSSDLEALLYAIESIASEGCLILPLEKDSSEWRSIRALWALFHVCQDMSADMTKALDEVHAAIRKLKKGQDLVGAEA